MSRSKFVIQREVW